MVMSIWCEACEDWISDYTLCKDEKCRCSKKDILCYYCKNVLVQVK